MNILKIAILSFVFGTISNQIGGLIGFIGKKGEKNINKTTSFAAGITTSIICFELLKESFEMATKWNVIVFTLIGVVLVKILERYIEKVNKGEQNTSSLVIVSAMAAHNITEGIAIGVGFKASLLLGISLLFAIMMHNIPEGMIIGIMLKKENMQIKTMLNICIIIGVFLSVGSIIGAMIGNINDKYIMPSLALSAGAMLYVLAYELIPSMDDRQNKKSGMIYIVGFLLGCLICKV